MNEARIVSTSAFVLKGVQRVASTLGQYAYYRVFEGMPPLISPRDLLAIPQIDSARKESAEQMRLHSQMEPYIHESLLAPILGERGITPDLDGDLSALIMEFVYSPAKRALDRVGSFVSSYSDISESL